MGHVAHHVEAGEEGVPVVLGVEEVLMDRHRRARIGRTQPDLAAAGRMQHHRPAHKCILRPLAHAGKPRLRFRRHEAGEELDVGLRKIGSALQESHHRPGHFGGEAGAEEVRLRHRQQQPVVAQLAHERSVALALEFDAAGDVILQILAHARQRHLAGDVVTRQLGRVADAREHEQLRRVDHAARHDHRARRAHRLRRAIAREFDAGDA